MMKSIRIYIDEKSITNFDSILRIFEEFIFFEKPFSDFFYFICLCYTLQKIQDLQTQNSNPP